MIGNKMTLQYKVDKQVLERLDDNIVVEKSLNFLYVKFIFSDEWRGLTKYALFNYIDIDSPYKLEVNKDGIVKVPYDLITFPGFLITLQGVNKSGVRITTETRMVDIQLLGTIDAEEKAVKYVTSDNNTINIDKNGDELDLGIETQLDYTKDTHTLDLYAITHNEKDDDGEPIEVETLLSSVVIDSSMIDKTYAELSTMRDNGELIAGQKYRITDYVTKVNGFINNVGGLARSMEHPFDIIVTAISNNKFSENAKAVLHEGDTYFANCDLSAWQLWYCFANDSTRFEWADTINGKGVIYRMIDEFDNDIPYDFKNVQFKRFKITGTTDTRQEELIGKYLGFSGSYAVTFDANDFKWYYTLTDDTQVESNDLSILSVYDHSYDKCRYAKQVAIGEYLADEPNYRYRQALNDIVLSSPSIIVDIKMREGSTKNTIIGNKDLTYNYFGAMFRKNIMYGEITHNKSDECMESNTIGNGTRDFEAFHWNRVGRHFTRNIVISAQATNFATGSVSDNKFPNLMDACDFNGWVQRNDFSGLNKAQGIKLHKVTSCTLSGSSSWVYCDFLALESCNINIDTFFGSKVDFLQKVTLTKNSGDTVNLINIDISTIIGSTTINLSDLLSYNLSGTRCHKELNCVKTNNGSGNRFEYTYDYVEDGVKSVLGAYSEDNGVTWLPLAQDQEVYNTLEITSEDITTEDDKIVFNSDVAQEIMSMNKRLRVDASVVDPRLEQGKFISVFTPRGVIDYSLPEGTIVYEYSTTNWLLDTYRTTYVEFLLDATTEKLYVYANNITKYEDHIVGFDTSFNDGNIRLTSNIDMRTSSISTLRINDLDTISFDNNPSLEFNANENKELESISFKQNGSTADFTYTIPKVVANPTLSGDEATLEGAEIDGIKYKVGGGSEVHLYSHKLFFIRSGTKVLSIIFEVFNASSTPIKVKDLNREENFVCNGSYGTNVVTYFATSAGNDNDVTLYGINQILGTVTINATDTITQIF